MNVYFTVWYTKNGNTVYSDVEIHKEKDVVKFAEKNLRNYEDAIIFKVTETDRRKEYKMIEAIFNNN